MRLVLGINDFGWPLPASDLAGVLAETASIADEGGFEQRRPLERMVQHVLPRLNASV